MGRVRLLMFKRFKKFGGLKSEIRKITASRRSSLMDVDHSVMIRTF